MHASEFRPPAGPRNAPAVLSRTATVSAAVPLASAQSVPFLAALASARPQRLARPCATRVRLASNAANLSDRSKRARARKVPRQAPAAASSFLATQLRAG